MSLDSSLGNDDSGIEASPPTKKRLRFSVEDMISDDTDRSTSTNTSQMEETSLSEDIVLTVLQGGAEICEESDSEDINVVDM